MLVGSLWFAVIEQFGSRAAHIYDLFIVPERRRNGHATRAFQAVETMARGLGVTSIGLHVFAHNHPAQAFYAKIGYSPMSLNLSRSLGD